MHPRVGLALMWKYVFYHLSPLTTGVADSLWGINQNYYKIPHQKVPLLLCSSSIPAGIVLHISSEVSLKISHH